MSYDDLDQLPENLTDDFICLDEAIRARYFDKYMCGTLSAPQRQEFEEHVRICFKCQEDVGYFRWVTRALTACAEPLPVSAIYDYQHFDLKPYYDEKPLSDRLAAAKDTSSRLTPPVTIEYLKGQVVGQFWKRPGGLFFRLKKSTIGPKRLVCTLIYTSEADPSDTRTFEFREGEEKRLGLFEEFVASDTIQAMLAAIKRFQLVLKDKNYRDFS